MSTKKRVAVLLSGRGSNMEALLAAASSPEYPAEIVGVLSNNASARGLSTARARGIEAVCVPQKGFKSRAEHDAAVSEALSEFSPDIVCLAGYMRVLTADIVTAWAGRMINIHPSLLPAFPGLDTHRRALEMGVLIHGCSVHFVTEKTDDGPIIAQAAVPVLPEDDAETLGQRVLTAEHRLYPMALSLVARGEVRLEGDRTVFAGAGGSDPDQRLFSPSPEEMFRRQETDLEHLARFTP